MSEVTAGDGDEARWWSLERLPGETLRAGLERTLRDAILSGALRAGVRLPGSRTLALELGVSRGVVSDAYDQLAAQGFLIVCERAAPMVAQVATPTGVATTAVGPRPEPIRAEPRHDLTATTPDVGLFPLSRWMTTAARAAQRAPSTILDYQPSSGAPGLREALADHLGRTRGVIASPEQIVITQGAAQAVELVLATLRGRAATRAAVEDPSHTGHHARIAASGLELTAQPTDRNGLVVDGLAADAVLVTPAHQFPTGYVMSADRRRQLLSWARATGAFVIEDDYDAEFRYDRTPVRALQGLAPDRVVQIGSVSKTLAPALRLGWLVAPPELLPALVERKALADEFSPALNQITLDMFLRSGDYDRHVRKARAIYRARRDHIARALARWLPEFPVAGIAAGVHVLLELPCDVDDDAIVAAAARQRIRLAALSRFCLRRGDLRGLIIGYGRLHESAASAAVRALAAIVREHLGDRSRPAQSRS